MLVVPTNFWINSGVFKSLPTFRSVGAVGAKFLGYLEGALPTYDRRIPRMSDKDIYEDKLRGAISVGRQKRREDLEQAKKERAAARIEKVSRIRATLLMGDFIYNKVAEVERLGLNHFTWVGDPEDVDAFNSIPGFHALKDGMIRVTWDDPRAKP